MRILFVAMSALLFLTACSSSSIKEKINKAGTVSGEAAGEFLEGASKGVEKAFDIKVSYPQNLSDKGLAFGKTTVTSDTIGQDNLLLLYVIFNQDFNGKLTAKVFDKDSLEMGRAAVVVSGKKDEAKFVEFHFDKRTNIDSKNIVTIE